MKTLRNVKRMSNVEVSVSFVATDAKGRATVIARPA
jgi:hypothetical protein